MPKDKEYRRPGKRGIIKGFTPAARLRMLRTVASINWGQVKRALFITLTYPDDNVSRDAAMRARDRYLFLRAMEKHLEKKVGVMWRVEWIERKTGKWKGQTLPHQHLIVFGVGYLSYSWTRDTWNGILGAKDAPSTRVDRVKGGKDAARYVTKYAGKKVDASGLVNASYPNRLGRAWGMSRKELIPFCERFFIPILDATDIHLTENLACMTFRYFTRGTQQGFSVFGENARKVGEILFERMIDKEARIA